MIYPQLLRYTLEKGQTMEEGSASPAVPGGKWPSIHYTDSALTAARILIGRILLHLGTLLSGWHFRNWRWPSLADSRANVNSAENSRSSTLSASCGLHLKAKHLNYSYVIVLRWPPDSPEGLGRDCCLPSDILPHSKLGAVLLIGNSKH